MGKVSNVKINLWFEAFNHNLVIHTEHWFQIALHDYNIISLQVNICFSVYHSTKSIISKCMQYKFHLKFVVIVSTGKQFKGFNRFLTHSKFSHWKRKSRVWSLELCGSAHLTWLGVVRLVHSFLKMKSNRYLANAFYIILSLLNIKVSSKHKIVSQNKLWHFSGMQL